MKLVLSFLVLIFGVVGHAEPVICQIRGNIAGYDVFLGKVMVNSTPSLYDALVVKQQLISENRCVSLPPDQACTIKGTDELFFTLFQGDELVSSFYQFGNVVFLRNALVEGALCVIKQQNLRCQVQQTVDGYTVFQGEVPMQTKTTMTKAQDLEAAMIQAKVCLPGSKLR